MARILLIRQGHYPLDARLNREIVALTGAGHEVDLICAGFPGQPRSERAPGLRVQRVPISRRRGGPLRYVLEFALFHAAATFIAAGLQLRRRYDVVQVNSIPDSLVFAAIVPRLLGARVLLDLCEVMPEFFVTKYGLRPTHPIVRLLGFLEQASIRFASYAITCTEQMRERFVERGASRDKIGVILLAANEERYDPDRIPPAPRQADRFVLICHGTLEEFFGVDTVIRAVALLRDEIAGLELKVYGDGLFRPRLESLATELGVTDRVHFSGGWAPLPELLAALASADAGVVATKRDAFRDLTHTNKMWELIAMRKPAIVSRTRSVEAYFDDSCFQLFESANEHDLARAIRELHADPERGARLARRAAQVSEPYRWVHQRRRYLDAVERLAGAKARGQARRVTAEVVNDP
jgi:glycosyltransferase involved in cell wall biosynthesis